METTKLLDRVVVEFKGPQGHTLANEFIANKLREIADAIEDGRSGDDFTEDIGAEFEILWEHESVSYGGFRMVSDKPLICQYYYHSEAQPIIIDRETIAKVVEWRKMFKEKDENNEYKYTDGDLVDDADDILKSIVEQWKEQSK